MIRKACQHTEVTREATQKLTRAEAPREGPETIYFVLANRLTCLCAKELTTTGDDSELCEDLEDDDFAADNFEDDDFAADDWPADDLAEHVVDAVEGSAAPTFGDCVRFLVL